MQCHKLNNSNNLLSHAFLFKHRDYSEKNETSKLKVNFSARNFYVIKSVSEGALLLFYKNKIFG